MDRLQRLKSRIGSEAKRTVELVSEDAIIETHHILMKEYGWIPIEEFRDLPIPTLWNLLDCIKKQHDMEKKEMDKMKHKGRR